MQTTQYTQQTSIGIRAFDSRAIGAKEPSTDLAGKIVNDVQHNCFALFVRFVHSGLRFAGAICLIVAAGYWLDEVNILRDPRNEGTAWRSGYLGWTLFAVGFLLDTIYSFVASLLAIAARVAPEDGASSTPGRITRSTFVTMYAEVGSWADVFRYSVQWITGLIITIFAFYAADLHKVQTCDTIDYHPPTATANAWERQQAVADHFYANVRVATTTDETHVVRLEAVEGESTCASTFTVETIGSTYLTNVGMVVWFIFARWLLNAIVMYLFQADRFWYIIPITCRDERRRIRTNLLARAQKETNPANAELMRKAAGNDPTDIGNTLVSSQTLDIPIVPVSIDEVVEGYDPETSQQSALVPECGKGCSCGIWEPFWYNILGSLRMHEYVAAIFWFLGFLALWRALGVDSQVSTYLPNTLTSLKSDLEKTSNNGINYFADKSLDATCSFFYNSLSPSQVALDNFTTTYYAPSRQIILSKHNGDDHASLASTFTMPAYKPCSDNAAYNRATHDITYTQYSQNQFAPSGATAFCCTSMSAIGPSEPVFGANGEQTNPMMFFAVMYLIGTIFYLISSVAYGVAITAFNQAPVPQVTLNGKEKFASM